MDINETLAAFQLDDADANRLAAILQGFQDNLRNKDLKIQALTLELAHLRRIRYGVKNEALSGIQRDLFEESWNEDVAEVTEHVEQLTVSKPKQSRTGRQPLPDHLPRIEHIHLEQIAARHRVTLSRSTLDDWVARSGVELQVLIDRLHWHLLQENSLHADETPVQQQHDPGNGKTCRAYL